MKKFSDFINEVAGKLNMKADLRKKANKALQKAIGKTYYTHIPMNDIMGELKKVGVIVLQEDFTEWSGMLMGDNHDAIFLLGDYTRPIPAHWDKNTMTYHAFDNTRLALQWYKGSNRADAKIEMNGYIT